MAKKSSKKVGARKDTTAKMFSAKSPKGKSTKSSVKLVTFEFGAVIPTQQYGNFQPKITVTADTIQEARDTVVPILVEMYAQYAEAPLNGREPKFLGKVEVTERVVNAPAPKVEPVEESSASSAPAPAPAQESSTSVIQKPEAVLKAEKALSVAQTEDAVIAIQEQIQKSVKIPDEFKPDLITMSLKRRNEVRK